VRRHKNSWIYLISTYYWWLLRPTITIRFDSKFQIIAQLFDSIRFEMKKNTIRTSLDFGVKRSKSWWNKICWKQHLVIHLWVCCIELLVSGWMKCSELSLYRTAYQTWTGKGIVPFQFSPIQIFLWGHTLSPHPVAPLMTIKFCYTLKKFAQYMLILKSWKYTVCCCSHCWWRRRKPAVGHTYSTAYWRLAVLCGKLDTFRFR